MTADDGRSDPSSTLPGYAAVVSAAALWAVAAVVARRLFDAGVGAVELTESRAVIAVAGFALVPAAWRPPLVRTRVAAGQLMAFGIALALVNATYYTAISRIPVAVALVIQYTAPALVVGWAALSSRRRPPPEVLAALVAALLGVALVVDVVSGAVGRMDGAGLAMAVASAFFFATYTVLAERTGALYGSSGAMLRAFAVASLFWVVVQLPRGVPSEVLEARHLPEVLFVGTAGTLVPFFLYVWGIARVRAERAAIAATLEPVVAAVVAWTWLDQSLSAAQLAGGALVIGAVAFLQLRTRRPVVAADL